MKRVLLSLVLLLLSSGTGLAALTHDADSTGTNNFGDTSITWSHTVGSGVSSGFLFATCSVRDTSARTISTATYNGTNLVLFNAVLVQGTNYRLTSYYALDANLGTKGSAHNVVFTWSGTLGGNAACSAHSYGGVDQTTPFGTVATHVGAETTGSVAVTSVSGDLVIDALTVEDLAITITGGQTSAANNNFAGQVRHGSSYLVASGTSTTMSWSWDGAARHHCQVGAALKAAAVASAVPLMTRRRR